MAERERVEEQLRRTNELFESAFSSIHVLVAYLDSQWDFVRVNLAFAENYGHEPEFFVGKNVFDVVSLVHNRATFERVLSTGEPHFAFEDAFGAGGEGERRARYWDWSLQPAAAVGRQGEGLVLCMISATERRRSREALQRSEERFRLLVENAHDVIFRWRLEPRFSVEYASPAMAALTGYTPEESYADPSGVRNALHPEDRPTFDELLQHPDVSGPVVLRWVHADGGVVWTELTVVAIRNRGGRVVALEGVARDITRRMHNERRILAYQEELRSLAAQVVLAEERERRRIAADLHDGVGQSLAVIRMRLGLLKRLVTEETAQSTVEETLDLLGTTIKDIRSLIFQISPPILYELGLGAAIEWLTERMQETYGIATEFADCGAEQLTDESVRVWLFRAVRELLINVVKHARAEHATVSLEEDDHRLRITVRDDGTGFDAQALSRPGWRATGFGLFSIRERLEYLGGDLTVESAPGAGTCVTMVAPLDAKEIGEGRGGHAGSAG
jgi:PAS domain S-box-containing protein